MGRDKRNENRKEPVTVIRLSVIKTDAWRALPSRAQALYPLIKLEWRGPNFNNNGELRLSVRQAAERMGCTHDTAARAFHDLQAKGFIIQTKGACLGTEGMGKAPMYELTEIPPKGEKGPGKQWFRDWKEGADFAVQRSGVPKKRKLKARPKKSDATVLKLVTKAEN